MRIRLFVLNTPMRFLNYVGVMATVLNLFGGAVWAQLARPVPQTTVMPKVSVEDCCIDCDLKDLCDDSECAQHLFPLDSPYEGTRFPNLGEYINFLKHYGWV